MAKPGRILLALAIGLAGAITATPSLAFPITYAGQAMGSGCLGNVTKPGGSLSCGPGTTFTDALVTITLTADTTNVISPSLGLYENIIPGGTAIVMVAGLGSATLTDSVAVFSNQNPSPAVAGFADLGFSPPLDIMDTGNTTFAAYDLKSIIGPISGSPAFVSPSQIFPTSDGGFAWTSIPASSTFAAVVVSVPAPRIDRGFPAFVAVVVFGVELRKRKLNRDSLKP
jgi:hypothetical protein